jgi:outer membrane protein assembly factor BamB
LSVGVAAAKLYFTDCISNKGVIVSYGNLTSLITKDGTKAWSVEVEGQIQSNNQIACGRNGEVYVSSMVEAPSHTGVGHGNGTLTVLTSDGKVKWAFTTQCATPGTAWTCFSSFRADDDGAVFVASSKGQFPGKNGSLLKLSAEGKQLWCSNLDGPPWDGFSLWLGQGKSEDILFVKDGYMLGSKPANQSVRAIAKSDGSTKWSVSAPSPESVIMRDRTTAVGKDGSLFNLVVVQFGGRFHQLDLVAYSAAGKLLWNHTLITGDWYQWYDNPSSMIVNGDGTIFTHIPETAATWSQKRTSVIAFSSVGEKKWNVSESTNGCSLEAPADARLKNGNVLIARNCDSPDHDNATVLEVNKNSGVQSVFHHFKTSDLRTADGLLRQPVVSPEGTVYLADGYDSRPQLYVLGPTGDLKRVVKGGFAPIFAKDGTAFVLSETEKIVDQKAVEEYSMLALDSYDGATLWEYAFKAKPHSEQMATASVMI